jgi:hypothetical protein
VQHWREKNEILTTDQHYFDILSASEPFVQIGRGSQSRKSAAGDYDFGVFHLC